MVQKDTRYSGVRGLHILTKGRASSGRRILEETMAKEIKSSLIDKEIQKAQRRYAELMDKIRELELRIKLLFSKRYK